MWGRAVDCVILLSLQEHLQGESTRYCPSALGSQIAGGLCVASILIDFRTFKLRKTAGYCFKLALLSLTMMPITLFIGIICKYSVIFYLQHLHFDLQHVSHQRSE